MHNSKQLKSFQYLGGKFSILPHLHPLLPDCHHWVEVMCGSAVATLNRKPSPIETINDVNGDVTNFFSVLRDHGEELVRLLELTPHSYQDYTSAWYQDGDTQIEKARKFFIRTQQSIYAAGAQEQVKGWAASLTQSRVSISEKTRKWLNGVDNLYAVAERLKHTQIENRDFRFIMNAYDSEDTLFYLDAPYDMTFRSNTTYAFDFKNQDFNDMHYYSKKAKAKVAVSGYDSPFMKDLFKDFNYHILCARKNSRSKKEVTECLWTNY